MCGPTITTETETTVGSLWFFLEVRWEQVTWHHVSTVRRGWIKYYVDNDWKGLYGLWGA